MTDTVDHIIEAKNLVLGNSRFLTLQLPHGWELAPGVGHPEVNASHQRRAVRWVANGDFWYVLYQKDRGWAMEINGRVRPFPDSKTVHAGETVAVGGHTAKLSWRVRRRGLPWHRHDVRFMTVEYDCARSERKILLEFSGWCPQEGFREVLGMLQALRCH